MYVPEIYKNENQEEIEQFIHENGFAILVNQTLGQYWATHIPLVLEKNADGKQILVGHIAKENPQGKSFINNSDVLAIFSGPNTYISSSWYDHENVPTWNYTAVHVYGKVKILDFEQTIQSLKRLVDKYERTVENPIRWEDLSVARMREARGVTAFEIIVTNISSVKKISQNRDDKNYVNIISELEKRNDDGAQKIADLMKKCPR